MKTINVGLLGIGIVGGGAFAVLRRNREEIARRAGSEIAISMVADKDVERARKAVTNRIRDALSRIESEHGALGGHLRRSIKTGTFCAYQPETQISWQGS